MPAILNIHLHNYRQSETNARRIMLDISPKSVLVFFLITGRTLI